MLNEKYKENISADLLSEIRRFLEQNQEDILEYKTCMEGYKLASQAFEELCESRKDYHEEYDEILKEFKMVMNPSCEVIHNNQLVANKLNELFSRMEINEEVYNLIQQLYGKKYY